MSRPSRPRNLRGCARGAYLAAVVAAAVPVTGLLAASAAAEGPAPLGPVASPHAEIRFPAPVRYAIVLQGPRQVRTLYAPGGILFDPRDASRSRTVVRVEAGALVLREGPRGAVRAINVGQPIPGFPGWSLAGTVLLDQLNFQYKSVDQPAHPDPVLIALKGSQAVLEVEILRSPAKTTLDGDLLEKVRVREISPGLYEVNAADLEPVLENTGRVLADLWPTVQPSLSLQRGLEYRVTSAAGDGVLSAKGFTLTAAKLAERAGLQAGDTILRVNGQPVDGFASVYKMFREVRRDPALSTVQVELDRKGTRLTKTYRIR